jgi:hypothetical protein
MIQAELRGNLGLFLCGSTGWNGGGNRFQLRRRCIPYKGASVHWLNVSGVTTSFSIGSIGVLAARPFVMPFVKLVHNTFAY